MAMPNPAMVTQKVRQAWAAMMPLNSTNWVQIRQGLGKMNSDTSNVEHRICHIAMMRTSRIQGAHISTCFLFMLVPCGVT
jgi:hypothetical protein